MRRNILLLFLFAAAINSKAQSVKYADSCEAGQVHSYDRNFKASIIAYETCLQEAKDSYHKGNICLNIGVAYFQLKDYTKAKSYYTLAAAHYAQARSQLAISGAAVNSYITEASINDSEMNLARNKGYCFCQTGEMDNAIAEYDKAINLGSGYAINYILKAECFLEKGNLEKAGNLLSQAFQKEKDNIRGFVVMGKIEKELKKPQIAKSYFMQAINKSDTYAEPYYQLGLMSMEDMKFADAIRYFNAAISKQFHHPNNFAKRATSYAKLGITDSAKADMQRAKAKFADEELVTEAALAIRMINIPQLVPNTIQSSNKELVQLYEKANLLKRERKMNQAFAEISKAIKLDPNNSDLYVLSGEIGLIMFELEFPGAQDDKKFDFEKNDYWWLAVDDLSKAIKLNSSNAAAFYLRGIAYLMANKKKEAIKDLEKADSLKPGNNQIADALRNAKQR
jgi:tetratricopeptide (TPR) repeat protein